jgi:hypothetical protein
MLMDMMSTIIINLGTHVLSLYKPDLLIDELKIVKQVNENLGEDPR